MGSWDWSANGNRDVLERIVARLLALACMADLAACLPFLRRREAVGILSYGEAAARAHFAGLALNSPFGEDALSEENAPAPADAPGEYCDALLLAARFRALAFMLAGLLSLADPSPPRRAAWSRPGKGEPAVQARRQATLPPPDTS
jgi:hypothetical protein